MVRATILINAQIRIVMRQRLRHVIVRSPAQYAQSVDIRKRSRHARIVTQKKQYPIQIMIALRVVQRLSNVMFAVAKFLQKL